MISYFLRYHLEILQVDNASWYFIYQWERPHKNSPCTFHVIFLIFCFLLSIDDTPTKNIWLRSRADLYLIMNFCLSISAQLFCKIKLLSFWVHLNVIPTCVIIKNLSWPPILQYIITNHASGWIVVFSNFLKLDFIGPTKESWRYMLLPLTQSELMWHCVYLIWKFPGFSMIFRMRYFMSLQWSLRINTWYGQ